MTDLERLADNLEISVKRNGEKPLTNKWLLNILKITMKQQDDLEMDLECQSFDAYWD